MTDRAIEELGEEMLVFPAFLLVFGLPVLVFVGQKFGWIAGFAAYLSLLIVSGYLEAKVEYSGPSNHKVR